MAEHNPLPLYQVRHPGGKDGQYRAGCSCGYVSGFYTFPGHAQNARDQQHQSEGGCVMTAESDLLAARVLPLVDRLIDLALVQRDIPAAGRVLAGLDRAELGALLGALSYRAVAESPFPEPGAFWACPTDMGYGEKDPELAGFRMVCAAGSRDNDMLVALVEVLMDRGLIAVGIAVRTILIIIREGVEYRAWGGA